MLYRYVALIIFACTFATLSPLRTYASSLPRVALSEINWSGSSLSTADEWIELANTSSEPIAIGSWKITGILSQGAEFTIPEGTEIAGHATYLISNYDLGDEKTALSISPNSVTTSVSLSNSSLSMSIFDETGALVDLFVSDGAPTVGTTSPHASAERNLTDGSWATSTTQINLLVADSYGTPGVATFPEEETPNETSSSTDVTEETSSTSDVAEASVLTETTETPTETTEVTSEEASETSHATEEVSEASADAETETETESEDVDDTGDESSIVLIEPLTTEVVTSSVTSTEETSNEETTETAETGEQETTSDTSSSSETSSPTTSEESTSSSSQKSETEETSEEEGSSSETTQDSEPEEDVQDYSLLHITEFVSNPDDGTEWIEFWNAGNNTLQLEHVSVQDSTGKSTTLAGTLEPNAYYLLKNPSGKLNNSGDLILVTLSDGQSLFSLTYGTEDFPASEKGTSSGYCADGWHTDLVPSPALENICPTTTLEITTYDTEISDTTTLNSSNTSQGTSSTDQGDAQDTTDSSASYPAISPVTTSVITSATSQTPHASELATPVSGKKSLAKTTTVELSIHELEHTSSGQHVLVTGVIVAEPGTFGKRIAYLNGVQLYFHKATWPSLPVGTSVRVAGVWDYDGDSRRIKIADTSDIEILGSRNPEALLWDDVTPETLGDILATASGTLLKKEGDTYLFSSTTGKDFRVLDTAKTGSLTALRMGDTITITGMLFPLDGTWVLAPRTAEDLVLLPSSRIDPAPSVASSSHESPTPLIGGGILASSASALGYWFLRTKKLTFLFS